jgi:hypothetical protein
MTDQISTYIADRPEHLGGNGAAEDRADAKAFDSKAHRADLDKRIRFHEGEIAKAEDAIAKAKATIAERQAYITEQRQILVEPYALRKASDKVANPPARRARRAKGENDG